MIDAMIVEGEVDIVVCIDGCEEMSLARLGPGQFFGEVELTNRQNSIASVRAANNGTELALLPREEFYQLVSGSPLTRDALREVAESRMSENKQRTATDC